MQHVVCGRSRSSRRSAGSSVFPALILCCCAALSCSRGTEGIYTGSEIVMGTIVEITVADRSEQRAREAIRAGMDEIRRIDDLMSIHKPDSLVSRVNRTAHEGPVPVTPELFGLLRQAVEISEASGGAFDVTIGPLARLWDFDRGGKLPAPREIAALLPLVGYRQLILAEDGPAVGLAKEGMQVDLGAIAKGFAADRAIEKIKERGMANAIVAVAGDLRIIGSRPGKDHWTIGVQHPRESGRLLMSFELRDTAVDTSGDYERFFEEGGVRYHHLLEPATGLPARGCRSVTVLAPTATEADACSTAAFVLGPEKGIAFLRSRPGVRGVIVGAGGELHWTDPELERMARR